MNLENENVHLEYKTAKNCLPKDFWRTYSAFANTDGGTVILGISEEKKFNYQIEGVINPDKIVNELITTLHNSNKVSCKLIDEQDIVHIIEDNKKLIKIKIHAANFDQKPVYLNGNLQNSYIRENDGDFKVKPEQLKYMIANSYTHLDNQLLENYSVKDLNTQDIDQYRELLIKNTNDTSFKDQNYETFLFNIGAIRIDRKDSKQKKKLTTGCLLFFGKLNAIMDRFPGFQLDFYRKKNVLEEEWVTRISSGDMNFPEMNIFSFYTLVLEQLERGIPDKFIQDRNFTRGSYHSDLMIAVKEALVNSLMHAYYSSDRPIAIYDYDDYFEFSNPGDMRVSKEEFIHGNNPIARNSIISLLFRKVGIAEKAGSGGPRIFKSAYKNNLRIPDIIEGRDTTTIRIWKINLSKTLVGFSETEKTIIKYAVDCQQFSIDNIKAHFKFSDYKARKIIRELENKKVIDRVGNGKATKYQLKESQEMGIFKNKLYLRQLEDKLNK